MGFVRHVGDEHLVAADVLIREIDGIRRDEVARQHPLLGVEREALDDVQLLAVAHGRRDDAGLEADGVDDEHVAFPTADRMTGVARRDVRGMLRHVHVDDALEAVEPVVDDDAVLLLRDAIDGAVEHPVEDDARRPATQARVVGGRPHLERVGLGLAARRVGHGPRAPARRRHVAHRELRRTRRPR